MEKSWIQRLMVREEKGVLRTAVILTGDPAARKWALFNRGEKGVR